MSGSKYRFLERYFTYALFELTIIRIINFRLIWLIIYSTLLSGTSVYIIDIYQQWQNKPIVINYADQHTSISEIPFPALTVCPLTKVSISTMNMSQLFSNMYNSVTTGWTYA